MVSTQHFRNRRIGRAGAVAMRKPCACPTPVPTPVALLMNATYQFVVDDGTTFYQVFNNQHRNVPVINPQLGRLDDLCDDAITPYRIELQLDVAGFTNFGWLYLDVGAGFVPAAIVAFNDIGVPTPFVAATQSWLSNGFNVDSGQITAFYGAGTG